MPAYFDRYVKLVPPQYTVIDALQTYGTAYLQAELHNIQQLGDRVYAPGKWTAKDILQHIIDAERIFAYRALRIARHDATPLPGFDENTYATHAHATQARTIASLGTEFDLLRRSNILFFEALTPPQLLQQGTSSGSAISPLALGFIMCGHIIHHIEVLQQRYY
jgi:hypothetical protein